MDGWSAESNAEILLNALGITSEYHYVKCASCPAIKGESSAGAGALWQSGYPVARRADQPPGYRRDPLAGGLPSGLRNTVIVVSHDRHFLNKVCTHIADVDFGKITLYVGNYDFWYEYTQMAQRQLKEQNKKKRLRKGTAGIYCAVQC